MDIASKISKILLVDWRQVYCALLQRYFYFASIVFGGSVVEFDYRRTTRNVTCPLNQDPQAAVCEQSARFFCV